MKAETKKLLDKAGRAIDAAETLARASNAEFAAGRAYYAMFYVAEALLREKRQRFLKHGAVDAAFAGYFVKAGLMDAKFHRWLLDAFDRRIQADYGLEATLAQEEAAAMIGQAREFLEVAERHLAPERYAIAPRLTNRNV